MRTLTENDEEKYRYFYKDVYKVKKKHLYYTVIRHDGFADINVQNVFTFNLKLFEVNNIYLIGYIKKDISATD